ncbi:MAG: NHL repeat-containing protein [Phycisphaerales bacterium]|nr:NHL repeat-containing protein [Phycisphaerales bacterium]
MIDTIVYALLFFITTCFFFCQNFNDKHDTDVIPMTSINSFIASDSVNYFRNDTIKIHFLSNYPTLRLTKEKVIGINELYKKSIDTLILSGNSKLELPTNICIYKSYIFIADPLTNQIYEANIKNGEVKVVANIFDIEQKRNQLNHPTAVWCDTLGNIYVTDAGNNRVLKFNYNKSKNEFNKIAIIVAGTMEPGEKLNQVDNPSFVYVDKRGYIYVADFGNNRIIRFPPNSTKGTYGEIVAGDYHYGSLLNQLSDPTCVIGDALGYLYVVDQGNNRVLRFPPNSTRGTPGKLILGGGHNLNIQQHLDNPSSLCLDEKRHLLFLTDSYNQRVVYSLLSGSYDQKIAQPIGDIIYNNNASVQNNSYLFGIALDSNKNLYMVDQNNSCILKIQARN